MPYRDVIGLFDLDNTTSSRITRTFLERAEREGRVINVAEDIPKSFAVCQGTEGGPRIYLSQLSTTTLLRRAENHLFE